MGRRWGVIGRLWGDYREAIESLWGDYGAIGCAVDPQSDLYTLNKIKKLKMKHNKQKLMIIMIRIIIIIIIMYYLFV